MKRLLSYLFIVLGLGLTFSVSAKEKLVFCEVRFITFEGEIIQAGQGGNYRKKYDVEPVYFANNKCYFAHDSYSGKRADHPQISLENYVDQVLNYRIRVGKSSVSNYYSVPLNVGKSLIKEFEKNKIDTSYLISVLENQHRVAKKDLEITKQTQIAKAEPKQTQKVASLNNSSEKFKAMICLLGTRQLGKNRAMYIFKDEGKSCKNIFPNAKNISYSEYLKITINPSKYAGGRGDFVKSVKNKICINNENLLINNLSAKCSQNETEVFVISANGKNVFLSSKKSSKTKIDKEEIATALEKARNKKYFCSAKVNRRNENWTTIPSISRNPSCKQINMQSYVNEKFESYFKNKNRYKWKKSDEELYSIVKENLLTEFKEYNLSISKLYEYLPQTKYAYLDTSKTKIVKKEKTATPEKKTKVVKTKESKQEEFKPKKTNQDNEAPVIEIAEAITVNSQAYTLKGKVKDKSQIYLTINGRQVDVKKGNFELDRFSIDPDVAEELKIVAIDQWNNRSEKTIEVTIDLQSANIVKVYEELKPNNVKVKTDKNKIAIIIGIEKYENLTNLDAKYANRDAKAFRAYAARALGIKPSNIKMLIDEKATRSQALKAFKLWLPKIAGKGGKDIHIFFAGHGLASDNGEDLYILPQDGESSLLEDTAISRVELISLINKVNPKSVTLFFDTCYSGQTRDERMLVASLRPIRIVADEQETPNNYTIFTASNYDQTSGSIEEAEHGMFSYYLMKGLEGKADENKDKKITNGELIAYLKDNVSQEAFTQNRQQDPMLAGDPNKVLMSYR